MRYEDLKIIRFMEEDPANEDADEEDSDEADAEEEDE